MNLNSFMGSGSLNRLPHQRIRETKPSTTVPTPQTFSSPSIISMDTVGYEVDLESISSRNQKPDQMTSSDTGSSTFWQQPGMNFPHVDNQIHTPGTPQSTNPHTPMSTYTTTPLYTPQTSYPTPTAFNPNAVHHLNPNKPFEFSNAPTTIPIRLRFEPFSGNIHPDILRVRESCAQHSARLENVRSTQKVFVEETMKSASNSGSTAASIKIDDENWQAHFTSLDTEHKSIKDAIDEDILILYNLNQSTILDSSNIHSLYHLHQELHIQLRQLEMYYAELQSLLSPSHNCFAALVVIKQPFPEVITKNKQLGNDTLTVRLLHGANTQFISLSPVTCILVAEQSISNKNSASEGPPLTNNVHPIDPQTFTASFPIKFAQGSRRTRVTLRFSLDATMLGRNGQAIVANIESNSTQPFIVTTNESQWEGSEQILLKSDVFGGMLEASWPQFCNTLQRHFLRATRQELNRPKRPLSQEDFAYFHEDYFGQKPVITQTDFDQFWNWFGKTLQVLRFQRYIAALWQQGLLYGCMSREEVNDALCSQPPGTFIIRFSNKYPGQFAIAYVKENEIKHYLVGQNDTAGAKKTLPDFLNEHPQFLYLLQLVQNSDGIPVLTRVPKGQSLSQFLTASPTTSKASEDGYESLSWN